MKSVLLKVRRIEDSTVYQVEVDGSPVCLCYEAQSAYFITSCIYTALRYKPGDIDEMAQYIEAQDDGETLSPLKISE